ncbi:patched domain-containing protein 3-like [Babylonia areolata]|uniref:patched domain-containing protein 3-like n=1 Tax=Babylonia areolata TaxID=304850 RepID=UPI003FD16198
MAILDVFFEPVTRVITSVFRCYGEFVGKHPLPFIIFPIIVFGGMGAGLVKLEHESDLEKVYFPKHSRAMDDRQYVRDTFPDLDKVSFNSFSQSDKEKAVNLFFRTIGGQSIFYSKVQSEVKEIFGGVMSLSSSGKTYSDICAKLNGTCVVDGQYVFSPRFNQAVAHKVVTYPVWNKIILFTAISGVTLDEGKLVSATVLKLSFKLAEDATDWKKKFLEYAESLDPTTVEVAYESPESLSDELDKSTKGDIVFFSLTMTVCCTYASLVTSGGNPVSTRSMLAFGGILAAGLGIVGSMGLLSACGVKFVNIVGVIPFLIIGIGVDDMFLMMSSWSEHLPSDPTEQNADHIPLIMSRTMASAGIGITITSITDFLAFVIGTVSVFMSVTNFSLYAGVGVLFCYLSNVTLFCGCLVFHGRRVYASRHTLTCQVSKPREQLRQEGKSFFNALLCGGSPPTKERDDESPCEKFPSKILPLLFKNNIVSIIIIVLFLGYLAVSIYGTINLQQGLILKDLVLDTSYYHKFLILKDRYFPTRIPVGLYVKEMDDYIGNNGDLYLSLLQQVKDDDGMDPSIERCWFTSFRATQLFNSSTPETFIQSVQMFLTKKPEFKSDVVVDSHNSTIIASRCFVFSKANSDQYDNAELMARMRDLADDSPLPVFAYHWAFVAFEQFVAVLPATLQLVGCALGVMTVVTFVFLPHVLMVLLVVLTIIMILVGIFGFLYYWDLTLSSITMIHLVMSVGFSVDFSAHVCTAYLLSHAVRRQDRARDAIRHAAGPILNGATSTMLGVLFLLASSSFIFQSFFKVMFLVILFGLLHAVFFLPAVLSLIGPENREQNTEPQTGGSVESSAVEKYTVETEKAGDLITTFISTTTRSVASLCIFPAQDRHLASLPACPPAPTPPPSTLSLAQAGRALLLGARAELPFVPLSDPRLGNQS